MPVTCHYVIVWIGSTRICRLAANPRLLAIVDVIVIVVVIVVVIVIVVVVVIVIAPGSPPR